MSHIYLTTIAAIVLFLVAFTKAYKLRKASVGLGTTTKQDMLILIVCAVFSAFVALYSIAAYSIQA